MSLEENKIKKTHPQTLYATVAHCIYSLAAPMPACSGLFCPRRLRRRMIRMIRRARSLKSGLLPRRSLQPRVSRSRRLQRSGPKRDRSRLSHLLLRELLLGPGVVYTSKLCSKTDHHRYKDAVVWQLQASGGCSLAHRGQWPIFLRWLPAGHVQGSAGKDERK